MVRRCEFCDSPVPADAVTCPVCRETIAEESLERILPLLKRPDSAEIRVMGIRARIWNVIRRPSAAFRDISQRPEAAGPFIVIMMNAAVIMGLFLALSSKVNTVIVLNATAGTTATVSVLASQQGSSFFIMALAGMIPNLMLGMIFLIIGTAFAHFAFKLTGGSGGKMKTLSIVGYSMTPVVLVRLFGILVFLLLAPTYPETVSLGSLSAGVVNDIVDWAYRLNVWLVLDVLTTGAFVWTGFLLIFGIREAHGTSTLWAVVVAILCTIVLGWTFWQVH